MIEMKIIRKNYLKHENDNYNGMDEYSGTDYYFTIDGETWYGETIDEILDDIVG